LFGRATSLCKHLSLKNLFFVSSRKDQGFKENSSIFFSANWQRCLTNLFLDEYLSYSFVTGLYEANNSFVVFVLYTPLWPVNRVPWLFAKTLVILWLDKTRHTRAGSPLILILTKSKLSSMHRKSHIFLYY
jgi:hypothetical protein